MFVPAPSQGINYLLPAFLLLSLYETKVLSHTAYPLLFGAKNAPQREKNQNIHLFVQAVVITIMGLFHLFQLNTEVIDVIGFDDAQQPINIVHFHLWMSVIIALLTNGLNIFTIVLGKKEEYFERDSDSLAERLQTIETIGRATIQKGALARIGAHKNSKLKNRVVQVEMDLADCPTTSDRMAIVEVTVLDGGKRIKVPVAPQFRQPCPCRDLVRLFLRRFLRSLTPCSSSVLSTGRRVPARTQLRRKGPYRAQRAFGASRYMLHFGGLFLAPPLFAHLFCPSSLADKHGLGHYMRAHTRLSRGPCCHGRFDTPVPRTVVAAAEAKDKNHDLEGAIATASKASALITQILTVNIVALLLICVRNGPLSAQAILIYIQDLIMGHEGTSATMLNRMKRQGTLIYRMNDYPHIRLPMPSGTQGHTRGDSSPSPPPMPVRGREKRSEATLRVQQYLCDQWAQCLVQVPERQVAPSHICGTCTMCARGDSTIHEGALIRHFSPAHTFPFFLDSDTRAPLANGSAILPTSTTLTVSTITQKAK